MRTFLAVATNLQTRAQTRATATTGHHDATRRDNRQLPADGPHRSSAVELATKAGAAAARRLVAEDPCVPVCRILIGRRE